MPEESPPVKPPSIAIQSVLYRTSLDALEKTLEAFDNTARVGWEESRHSGVVVVLGDASPSRLLSDEALEAFRTRFTNLTDIIYTYFGENVGTSRGHNTMATFTGTDFIVTSNPDVIPEPQALWRMLSAFDSPATGMVEAKQLPIEHPKDYDSLTGFTSWAATAFAMTRRDVFEQLEGFDSQSFFMYCDDVDYSWRVWEADYTVVFQPAAVVFHDKTLTVEGHWVPTSAETYYSAEAAMILAHKWSRDDIVEKILGWFEGSEDEGQRTAAAEFIRRRENDELVDQRDPENVIATFVDDAYAKHRFTL